MLADADSGAFQALVEQGSQLDRPVITEAFRDRAPDDSWRLTVYKPKTAGTRWRGCCPSGSRW